MKSQIESTLFMSSQAIWTISIQYIQLQFCTLGEGMGYELSTHKTKGPVFVC